MTRVRGVWFFLLLVFASPVFAYRLLGPDATFRYHALKRDPSNVGATTNKFYYDPTGSPEPDSAKVIAAFRKALEAWNAVPGHVFQFDTDIVIETQSGPRDPDDHRHEIYWVTDSTDRGTAWTSLRAHGSEYLGDGADIAFNTNIGALNAWYFSGLHSVFYSDLDFTSVATHELGHFLGAAHPATSSSLMYGVPVGETRTITTDDALIMRQLYGAVLTTGASAPVSLNPGESTVIHFSTILNGYTNQPATTELVLEISCESNNATIAVDRQATTWGSVSAVAPGGTMANYGSQNVSAAYPLITARQVAAQPYTDHFVDVRVTATGAGDIVLKYHAYYRDKLYQEAVVDDGQGHTIAGYAYGDNVPRTLSESGTQLDQQGFPARVLKIGVTQPAQTLTVQRNGTGSGTVVSSPAGISCGSVCSSAFAKYTPVTLTASALPGSTFAGWSGDCSSSPCQVTMVQARSVTATFNTATATLPPPPALISPGTPSGGSTGSLRPTFFWQNVAGADQYQLELSDGVTTFPLQTIAAPATSVLCAPALVDNHAYQWRMRAHNAAGWGAYGSLYSFSTYTGFTSSDFTIQSDPPTGSASQGGTATFSIATVTSAGSAQTVTLSTSALPAGVSASFAQTSIQSGSFTTLTVTVSNSATPSTFTIIVTGSGSAGATHAVNIGFTVNPLPGTGQPAVCLSPPSLGFSNQMVGTSSPLQTVAIQNCGNGPLHINSYYASPDFFIGAGSNPAPVDLPVNTSVTFTAGFAPLAEGPRTGTITVYSNAPGSPTVMSLAGTATPAPVTTGTIHVQAFLNNEPYTGPYVFSLTGPNGKTNYGAFPATIASQAAGSYTAAIEQPPLGTGTLDSISPAATQTLTAGGSIIFTFYFTAANQFYLRGTNSEYSGETVPLTLTPGSSGSTPLTVSFLTGGNQTIQLSVTGVPGGATATFDPPTINLPYGSYVYGSLAIGIGAATPSGFYHLTITATNQDGFSRTVGTTLVVPSPTDISRVSVSTGGTQANNWGLWTSTSADGQYVAFMSEATNLVAGDTNGQSDAFLRDRATGTTTRISVASDGSQGNDWSGQPALSGDGRYAAFRSFATNFAPGAPSGIGEIYVRDLLQGRTTRVSLANDGSAANGECWNPAITADGRFITFSSRATNLITDPLPANPAEVYVRDLVLGTTELVSRANDGAPANRQAYFSDISADGRFVAFLSSASNLAPALNPAASEQVYVYDRQAHTVEMVSGPANGAPPNDVAQNGFGSFNSTLCLSADGRYVAFTSYASNLVPNDTNYHADVFVRDRQTGTTTAASVSSEGLLLGGGAPAMSADGRFIAVRTQWPQVLGAIMFRDRASNRTILPSSASGAVPLGNGNGTKYTALSSDGRVLALSSNSADLVAGDTNNLQDIFAILNPGVGAVYAQRVAITPPALPGGSTASGTVILNAPAPAEGATVQLTTSNVAADVPGSVTVAAGRTSATFSIPTFAVAQETPVAIVASYGGGSPLAILTLQKARPARIEVSEGDRQSVLAGALLPLRFKVLVLDAANQPYAGASVQFAAPAAEPSGTFAGGVRTATVTTDASGIAVAPLFTAGSLAGSYAVSATVAGVAPALFTVTNTVLLIRSDFNGDARSDLFWTNPTTGETSMWFMNGAAFTPVATPPVPSPWRLALTADFDGDHTSDFFWHNPNTGETSMWLGWNGSAFGTVARSLTVPLAWRPMGSGDFDGDGKADLFWMNTTTGETSIWFMSGSVIKRTIAAVTVPVAWQPVLFGDFDGDGVPDVFWRNPSTGETSIWRAWNGTAFTILVRAMTVPTTWAPAGGGDFDGDAKTDIFWFNATTGETSIWFMDGNGFSSAIRSITVPVHWTPSAFGDYDGDHRADVFWWNDATGQTSLWLGWNGSTFGTLASGASVPVAWRPAM